MSRFVQYDNPPIKFISYSIRVSHVYPLGCRSSKYDQVIFFVSSCAIYLYKGAQFGVTCSSRGVIKPITSEQHTLFKRFSKIFNTNNLLEDSVIIVPKSTFSALFHANATIVSLFPFTPFLCMKQKSINSECKPTCYFP